MMTTNTITHEGHQIQEVEGDPDTSFVDLDFVFGHGKTAQFPPALLYSTQNAARDLELEAYASAHGVEFEVKNPYGPAGGWPIVRFAGTAGALVKLIDDYESTD